MWPGLLVYVCLYHKILKGDIVVLQNGVVSKHHFEDAIGAEFDLRYVEAEEKQQIIDKYKEYKKDSKNGQ